MRWTEPSEPQPIERVVRTGWHGITQGWSAAPEVWDSSERCQALLMESIGLVGAALCGGIAHRFEIDGQGQGVSVILMQLDFHATLRTFPGGIYFAGIFSTENPLKGLEYLNVQLQGVNATISIAQRWASMSKSAAV